MEHKDFLQGDLDARLEGELAQLAERVKESARQESVPHKEALKNIVVQESGARAGEQPATGGSGSTPSSNVLPDYMATQGDAVKVAVAQILDEAVHKGIFKAVKDSLKASPYLANAVHDSLTDKLYAEMKSRKYL